MQKKEVLSTFKRYLKRKGFNNVKMPLDEPAGQNLHSDPWLNPDLTAENKGVTYYYKYIAGRDEASAIASEMKAFLKRQPEVLNRKLKLLVPIRQSDDVIQSLNAHQLENVGVIKVSQNKATA